MAELTDYGREIKKTFPEKFKMFEKAMELTNGKCDNDISKGLLFADDVTTEDFVKLGGKCNSKDKEVETGCAWLGARKPREHVIWYKPEQYGDSSVRYRRRRENRNKRFDDATVYQFKDTFMYRILKNNDFPFEKLEYPNGYLNQHFRVSTPDGPYDHTITSALIENYSGAEMLRNVYAFMKMNKNLRNEVANDTNLCEMWVKFASVEKYINNPYATSEKKKHPITCTEEEYLKFQTQALINEFDWLSKMPKDLKKQLTEYIEDRPNSNYYKDLTSCPAPFYICVREGVIYPAEDKVRELVKEAFDVMNYIGIGICWVYKVNDGINYMNWKKAGLRIQPILKKISSMMRVFVSQVRKGYSPEDVREMIIEDINNWIISKVGHTWQLYIRTDAPTSFPDIEPKKKESKKKVGLESLEADPNKEVDAKMIELVNKSKNS